MKITKSQLRKIIKEELSSLTSFDQTDMSAKGLIKRTQDLYNEFTIEGFDKFSGSKLQDLYNDLQDIKTKHSKEKGRDEEYEILMKLEDATNEMFKAVRYKNLSLLDRGNAAFGNGIPTDPHMSWLMSQ